MDLTLKSEELHIAQMNMGNLEALKEEKLDLQTEHSNANATRQKLELLSSRKNDTNGEKYYDVMRELCNMKKELTRLKLNVAAAVESKAEAEKLIEYSNSRAKSYLSSAEELDREIEEANMEQVLVELARNEAEKECKRIEAQRKDNAARFSKKIDATREKIHIIKTKVGEATDIELKLAVTNSDLSVLQSEMGFLRAMEKNFPKNLDGETESELKAAKKELARIQEEGHKFMASVDAIRKELIHISKQTEQIEEREKKADSSIQQLNAMLLRARAKLDSATAAQEKSEALVSSLSYALQRAQQEIDLTKKEREAIAKKTRRTKLEVELIEAKIGLDEERLQAAAMELEAVKASEAAALKQLRDVAQTTMKERNFLSEQSCVVTISKSEYEYLISSAESARAVADKKVDAAQAWIAALKALEKEFEMKTELIEKESGEKARVKLQKPLTDQKIELKNEEAKAVGEKRASTASVRRASMRRRSSISSGTRNTARVPSITIKKRAAVMPNLAMLLNNFLYCCIFVFLFVSIYCAYTQ